MTRTGIIGGAALPHAPQFFTLPDTEDHDQVARVRAHMAELGEALRALEPEVIIIASNDHLENFVLHCVPPFAVHCGAAVKGSFAGHDFGWSVASELAVQLVRGMQDQGFDPAITYSASIGYEFGIPLTFCGMDDAIPIVPIFVNAYVVPQPSPDRCYALGAALARSVAAAGVRAVMLASGGLSHYPDSDRYGSPDLETDADLLERLRRGNLRSLLSLGGDDLDRSGNAELRSWHVLAGALGERVPDVVVQETSWHHDYAVLGWTSDPSARESAAVQYTALPPERIGLTDVLYQLRMESEVRQRFLADRDAFADGLGLDDEERGALCELDEPRLRKLGVHPILAFLARLQVDIEQRSRA